jgi:hypothetical protein
MSDRATACPHCGSPFSYDQYYESTDYRYWLNQYETQKGPNNVGIYTIYEDENDSGSKSYSVYETPCAKMYLEKARKYAPESERYRIDSILRYTYQDAVARARELDKTIPIHKRCYIATAVYGDFDAPEVITLRQFRDEKLCKSTLGRVLISVYYTLSPPIANYLRKARTLNSIVKRILDRIVMKIKSGGNKS